MSFKLDQIRQDTPSCAEHIHLDNAGGSLMPKLVVERMIEHIRLEASIGGYEAQDKVADELAGVYAKFAGLIGAKTDEVAFLSSATSAWDRAFYSMNFKAGDRVITGFNEYCSNYVALLDAEKKFGIHIIVIGANKELHRGDLDLTALEEEAKKGAKLISISHVPSSSGQINPVKAVGDIAKKYDIPYLLDACQSLGQLAVDMADIGCDMASFTTRKFMRGPRGVGALYVSNAMRKKLSPVFLTNQGALWVTSSSYELLDNARVFEAWERNVTAHLGFGVAVEYLQSLDEIEVFARLQKLSGQLRQGLHGVKNIEVTDPGQNLAAIVTCTVKGKTANEVRQYLAQHNITGQVASVFHTRLDLEFRGHEELVRLSPHYYISEDEIEKTIEIMSQVSLA